MKPENVTLAGQPRLQKFYKPILCIFGLFLVFVLTWGVLQINDWAALVSQDNVEPALSQEELVQQRLAALAAQNPANQVKLTSEEVSTRLEALSVEREASSSENTSDEEVKAHLKILEEAERN